MPTDGRRSAARSPTGRLPVPLSPPRSHRRSSPWGGSPVQPEGESEAPAAQEHVDTERTRLETERREIAQERQQAPIVAEATRGTGLLLVCALPLAVVIHLIYSLRSRPDQDDVLTEILLQDLVAEEPRLFGYRTPAMMAPEDNARVEALPGRQADQDH